MSRTLQTLLCTIYVLATATSVVVCQGMFSFTFSPRSTADRGLCPELITFTCTVENVPGLGTALRWYFNDVDVTAFEYIYQSDLVNPEDVFRNDTFVVVAQNARLDGSNLAAEVTLQVNASTLVSMGITMVTCGRSLTTRNRNITISNQLDNMDAPRPLPESLSAVFSNTGLQELRLNLSEETLYEDPGECMYKQRTEITVTTLVDNVVFNVTQCDLSSNVTSCQPSISNIPANASNVRVNITAVNSLGLSNTTSYPVRSFFNATFNFNTSNCNLMISCEDVSTGSLVEGCEVYNTTTNKYVSISRTGYTITEAGNTIYQLRAMDSDGLMIILLTNYSTESCTVSGPEVSQISVGAIVGIVFAVTAFLVLVIIILIVVGVIFLRSGNRRSQNVAHASAQVEKEVGEMKFSPTLEYEKNEDSYQPIVEQFYDKDL